ncbi:MAG: UDP-N-acetylglucosamine--N-acetylmuramyl-(pentapeptide) pyrophosphoryl-undecaprenol N-acetylglucosamine transferase [Oceanospirillaceae bacterium]|jgi:UDP-N-acetylglucosamine--N-acetylmuramyl-(pentapeptide) pyrophosphoryl-undecaprenol N-acetylglucosamine transferase
MSGKHPLHKKALIMAGGTGGHVFPALAVADLLREHDVTVHWLGTAAGIEAKVVPAADIKLHCIAVKGIRGKGKLSLLKAPWLIIKAIWQAKKVFDQVQPDVVLGMGGFASGPGAVAAKLSGVPLIIHEQNAKAGMTNKLSLVMAKRKLAAFPAAFGSDSEKNIEVVGNPIRGAILSMQTSRERYAQRTGKLNVLIVGGSLGAMAINKVVPDTLATIDLEDRPNIWHQAGIRNIDETALRYKNAQVEAQVDAFIDDMQSAYAWADLVICRAGALTVSELAIAGVAAILVPFPAAVDDHQTANGKFLENAGAAILVQQKDLDIQKLSQLLAQLKDRKLLSQMAAKAQQVASPKASITVANICLKEML